MENNFIGTWRTRNGTKVQILSVHSTGTCFNGRVLEPYISPNNEIWSDEGNHWQSTDLDLMERISEKDPRR